VSGFSRTSGPDANADHDGEQGQPERQRELIDLVSNQFSAAKTERKQDHQDSQQSRGGPRIRFAASREIERGRGEIPVQAIDQRHPA